MVQAKLAEMYVRLNASRSYLYNVARALDNGHLVSKVGLMMVEMVVVMRMKRRRRTMVTVTKLIETVAFALSTNCFKYITAVLITTIITDINN